MATSQLPRLVPERTPALARAHDTGHTALCANNDMGASRIETLPDEPLDLIVQHVENRATLYALCLVSRDMNRIATARLYAHIQLEKDDFRHLRPLALLFWTSAPHRQVVRSFGVRHAYGGNLDPWPHHPELDAIISKNLELYVRPDDQKQWFNEVRDGADSTRIASLLLRSLPHVMTMQLPGFELVDPAGRNMGLGSRHTVW
ncbi:hypothetical protein ACJBU6_07365 [Exserohilum turcicum]